MSVGEEGGRERWGEERGREEEEETGESECRGGWREERREGMGKKGVE